MKNEGKRLQKEKIGQRLPELTPVDCPLMDDPNCKVMLSQDTDLKGKLRSNGRLKQEKKAMHNFM